MPFACSPGDEYAAADDYREPLYGKSIIPWNHDVMADYTTL